MLNVCILLFLVKFGIICYWIDWLKMCVFICGLDRYLNNLVYKSKVLGRYVV